jgi:hypothetical protein
MKLKIMIFIVDEDCSSVARKDYQSDKVAVIIKRRYDPAQQLSIQRKTVWYVSIPHNSISKV